MTVRVLAPVGEVTVLVDGQPVVVPVPPPGTLGEVTVTAPYAFSLTADSDAA